MKKMKKGFLIALFFTLLFSINVSASAKTVASIGNKNYSSMQQAIKAVKNGQTIKLKANVKDVRINRKVKFTLNLNKHKITESQRLIGAIDINKATVTLKNGTVKGRIYVQKQGNLTLAGGTYSGDIINSGKLTVKKGTTVSNNGNVLVNEKSGTMKISGGTFKGKAQDAPCISNSGKLTITGGAFSATGYARVIHNGEKGNVSIKSGTFYSQQGEALINWAKTSTATISGGTFWAKKGLTVVANSGKLTMNGGTIKSTITQLPSLYMGSQGGALDCRTNSTTVIKKGTISSKMREAVHVYAGAVKFQLSGGSVKCTSPERAALYVDTPKSTVSINESCITSAEKNGNKIFYLYK